jgi:predicted Zn-dependent peptidase
MRNRISRNVYGELFWGRQMPVEEIVADIEKVKTEDLTLLANDLLRTQDLSLVVVGPSSELKRGYSLVC